MIKITKKLTNVPETLDKRKLKSHLKDIEAKASNGTLKSKDFKSRLWSKRDVKYTLTNFQNKKCAYCEKRRDAKELTVEHYRPKTSVTEDKDHSGYWWLAYDHTNYFITCSICNSTKGNKFPLINESQRCQNKTDDLKKEQPYLLNPIFDNPSDFIEYIVKEDDSGRTWLLLKGKDPEGRGEKTIEILKLKNREDIETNLEENLADLIEIMKSDYQLLIALSQNGTTNEQFEIINEFENKLKEKIQRRTSKKYKFTAYNRAFFEYHGLDNYITYD